MTRAPKRAARPRRPHSPPRSGRGGPGPSRDHGPSTFATILDRLIRATPGALGAALVDYEGETVDYAGSFDTYELKVSAAHWQLVVQELDDGNKLGGVRQLNVHAQKRSYLVRRVHEHYTIVVVLHRHAAFAVSERALQEAEARLCVEAGFPVRAHVGRWCSVDIEPEPADRARPAMLRGIDGWQPLEVMGCMVGLVTREKGFRVRLATGAEMMLVRDRFGRWFSDEHVED